MKSNEKQIFICNKIIEQAEFWKYSNDINSPTHFCDLDESFNIFGELELTEKEKNLIINKLCDILLFIRKL